MKYLIGLSLFQAVVLLFFGARVMEIDARTNRIAEVVEKQAAQAKVLSINPYTSEIASSNGPTIEDIRWAIRQEIAAIDGQLSTQDRRSANTGVKIRGGAATREQPNAASAVDTLYLKDTIHRDLDSYIGLGKIEPAEMADLQFKIAKLPPGERREMLTRLTKAMNAGDLEGEF